MRSERGEVSMCARVRSFKSKNEADGRYTHKERGPGTMRRKRPHVNIGPAREAGLKPPPPALSLSHGWDEPLHARDRHTPNARDSTRSWLGRAARHTLGGGHAPRGVSKGALTVAAESARHMLGRGPGELSHTVPATEVRHRAY